MMIRYNFYVMDVAEKKNIFLVPLSTRRLWDSTIHALPPLMERNSFIDRNLPSASYRSEEETLHYHLTDVFFWSAD